MVLCLTGVEKYTKMANKTKKCTSCRGTGRISTGQMAGVHTIFEECSSCEGTGVVLFDEDYDNIHDLYTDDDSYFKEE